MVHCQSVCIWLCLLMALISISYGYVAESDQEHQSVIRNKRGWNGAKGMWGKRSDDSLVLDDDEDVEKRAWNKATGMWGKRADLDELDLEEKRGTWNKANGMWGKRTGWSGAKGMWGRRKRQIAME